MATPDPRDLQLREAAARLARTWGSETDAEVEAYRELVEALRRLGYEVERPVKSQRR